MPVCVCDKGYKPEANGSGCKPDQQPKENALRKYEFRVGLGAKTNLDLGGIPTIPTLLVSFDFARYGRLEVDFSCLVGVDLIFSLTLAGGAAFEVYRKRRSKKGDAVIKIPILAELGFETGNFYAGDGYEGTTTAFLLGLSTGVDFTWWRNKKSGFNLRIKVNYLGRFEGEYSNENTGSNSPNKPEGVFSAALLFGAVF
jgi:hypothetical protein